MSRHEAPMDKESDIASFSKGIEDVECGSFFGQYTVQEMITRLKGLALDPCVPQFAPDNIQPLWNQILRLRKFILHEDSEMPWRKRELEQFAKDKMRPPAAFVTPNKTKRRRQLPEPPLLSCLLNSIDYAQSRVQKSISESRTSSSLVTFDEALSQKQVTTQCSFADDVAELNRPSKAQPSAIDSDESINGSNPSSPVDLLRNEVCRIGDSNVVHNLNSPAKRRPAKRRRLKLEPSDRLLFIEDILQRKAMPVGPRFQADIPEWDDTSNTSVLIDAYRNDSNASKWLGTWIWPIETGRTKSGNKRVGKGRPNSCSCASRGSTDCTKRHVLLEKLLLQRELGPAFSSWKFEEMGEQAASESWSLKEQHAFVTMMKKKPPSNGKAFWNRVSKSLPRKSRKDIVHYYFDVYIPNRMSSGRRSLSMKRVDTDDEDEDEDEDENVASIGLLKRVERIPTIPKKKAKYLLGS